jgi:beta-N-acetylhexosaminidase
LFRKHGKIIGESCCALGFNTDFAPTVDLAWPVSRKVMGSRVVSDKPKEVALYAREFLAGLRSARVLGAIKHFPGLGAANLDTHKELPRVNKAWKQLWEEDIQPYRLLRREAPMVMVGHANYPAVTRDRTPASLSRKWITDILRRKIGYRGLVISDDLEMGGVLKAAPVHQAAVEHIRAGGDLCLVCHQEEFVAGAFEALTKEAERDRKFAARLAESAKRVEAFKNKSREIRRRTSVPSPAKLERLSRALWEFSEQVRFQNIPQQARA